VQKQHGFTLIEMVVVVAIIIALAGILVPIVTNELDEAKKSTAQATVNRLATAITQYMKDTSFPPTGKDGAKSYHYLSGAGIDPDKNKFASGSNGTLNDFLANNTHGTRNWKGPYLAEVAEDPWGRAYVVNVHGYFNGKERVWVLSSGPDQKMDTNPRNTTLGGDDIGMFID